MDKIRNNDNIFDRINSAKEVIKEPILNVKSNVKKDSILTKFVKAIKNLF